MTPHPSRKRPRSNDEDSHKFMPTSKKFSDSDVRFIFPDSSSSPLDNVSEMQYQNALKDTDVIMTEVQTQVVDTSNAVTVHSYRPELSPAENPFYYHVNGILYEAHMQRLLRLSNGVA